MTPTRPPSPPSATRRSWWAASTSSPASPRPSPGPTPSECRGGSASRLLRPRCTSRGGRRERRGLGTRGGTDRGEYRGEVQPGRLLPRRGLCPPSPPSPRTSRRRGSSTSPDPASPCPPSDPSSCPGCPRSPTSDSRHSPDLAAVPDLPDPSLLLSPQDLLLPLNLLLLPQLLSLPVPLLPRSPALLPPPSRPSLPPQLPWEPVPGPSPSSLQSRTRYSSRQLLWTSQTQDQQLHPTSVTLSTPTPSRSSRAPSKFTKI